MAQKLSLKGEFRHVVYSPKGAIEGVLIDVDGQPAQLVFERHDDQAGLAFEQVAPGQTVSVLATREGPSPKGVGEHPVYAFSSLASVDGEKPTKPRSTSNGPAYRGQVVRMNYARHGAANGVVLDTGDFIHTKPEGMAKLKLKVGDTVSADGDAQRLLNDQGWAVEATSVNGKPVGPH